LGDKSLSPDVEKELRRRYVMRALELLKTGTVGDNIYTVDGTL
jgi:hypothetical protein